MQRHVDGGASLLHLSLGLCGFCTVRFESAGIGNKVEVLEVTLCPGDVYIGSPACCYHCVAYDATTGACDENGLTIPSTFVLHLRSELLRMRTSPSWFHKTNALLAVHLAPVVADALASDPLRLPCLADVEAAEVALCPEGTQPRDVENAFESEVSPGVANVSDGARATRKRKPSDDDVPKTR